MVVRTHKLWVNLGWKKVPGPVQHRNVTNSKQVLWRGFRKIARFLTAPRTFPVLLCPPQSWRAFSQVLSPSNSCPLVYLWHLRFLKSCLLLHFARSSCPRIHLPILDPCFLAACPEPWQIPQLLKEDTWHISSNICCNTMHNTSDMCNTFLQLLSHYTSFSSSILISGFYCVSTT